MKNSIHTEQAPRAIGPYSQAIAAGGLVFCSGQMPLDPVTMKAPDTLAGQARQALENLKAVALAAGCTLDDAVRVGLFLASMDDFAEVNKIYEEYFTGKPARTTVEVSRLPRDVRLEVDCILFKES